MPDKIRFSVFFPCYMFRTEKRVSQLFNRLQDAVLECEMLGYYSVWLDDHLMLNKIPILECWTTLSALSRATETIRLGTMVTCNSFRNPALLAKMAATLDNISNGRLELGIGAGVQKSEHNAYGFHFLESKSRIERLNEAVEIAGARDVTLAVETHAGAIVVQPDASREMLDRVPGLTLTYDPSHYIAEEIAVEDTLDLIAHASHAHMRNARIGHFQETMAKGDLDIGWLIDQMMAAGYNGAISVEYIEDCGALKEGYDTVPEIEQLKAVLLAKGCLL